jgi:DNA-binding transcriptional MerR regulator
MTPNTNMTSKPSTLPPIMSVDDVSATFGVSSRTLRTWVSRGSFPQPTRPSGSVRGRAYWTAEQVKSALDKKAA